MYDIINLISQSVISLWDLICYIFTNHLLAIIISTVCIILLCWFLENFNFICTFRIDAVETDYLDIDYSELYIRKKTTKKTVQKKVKCKDIIADREEEQCCICLTHKKIIAFQPCGHVSCCNKCATRCEKCPICRQYISQQFRVFI